MKVVSYFNLDFSSTIVNLLNKSSATFYKLVSFNRFTRFSSEKTPSSKGYQKLLVPIAKYHFLPSRLALLIEGMQVISLGNLVSEFEKNREKVIRIWSNGLYAFYSDLRDLTFDL